MNLRWLLFDYSDPDLPLSFWKRQKMAWRRVPIRSIPVSLRWRRIVFGLGTALPSVVALPLAVLVIVNIERQTGRVGSFVPLLLLLAVPIFWIWACVLYGFFMRTDHYHRIRLEGFDVCLKCGYWLRGLGDEITNCPECGAKREAMPEPEQPQMDTDERGS